VISNLVEITPAYPPFLAPDGRYTSIDGITVRWGRPRSPSNGYEVPSLGVQIDASGALADTILATLRRPGSPEGTARGPVPGPRSRPSTRTSAPSATGPQ
jgi:hypothetical protein